MLCSMYLKRVHKIGAPPLVRVEKMFEDIQSKLLGAPQFLLYLLPERKSSDLYGPWK
ncbi:unnamed protein product [Camellia sinensis]